MPRLVLASTSPRRHEILARLGIDFDIVEPDYLEDMTLALPPDELAAELAKGKGLSVAEDHPDAVIVSADTFVTFGGNVMGKPATEAEALDNFRLLSGQECVVFTGVAVIWHQQASVQSTTEVHAETVAARIRIAEITQAEAHAYVRSGIPFTRAAGLALDGIGSYFIEAIDGDVTAVAGLPLRSTAHALERAGLTLPWTS